MLIFARPGSFAGSLIPLMNNLLIALAILVLTPVSSLARQSSWRQATEKELASLVPSRAQVEKERIETELRTASGITDGKGKFIAGVVLITAGYAAEGKYSHFFITRVPIRIGQMSLRPGDYVFGYRRLDESNLEATFYEASTGKQLGTVRAVRQEGRVAVRSLLISPPSNGKAAVLVGRFAFEFALAE
jgi:hypothetical protein